MTSIILFGVFVYLMGLITGCFLGAGSVYRKLAKLGKSARLSVYHDTAR